VTSDEIDDISTHRLITTVNGTIMQDAEISDLAIGIPQLIEQFSRYFAFHPGDVISTGTPAGVGAGQRPPLYLSDGDQVTVSVDGIGNLSNRVISAHPCDTAR
jgi:2-keto-4-pentenoate hydratase/2-oxohepta-3-ene-1,7-dioic acid hydratase in catechol pathway